MVGGMLVALSVGGAWAQDVKQDVKDMQGDRQDHRPAAPLFSGWTPAGALGILA